MARNLFNTGNNKTTIADTEKLAAGSGAANAFNITFLAFKKLFSGLWFGGVEKVTATAEGATVNGGVIAKENNDFIYRGSEFNFIKEFGGAVVDINYLGSTAGNSLTQGYRFRDGGAAGGFATIEALNFKAATMPTSPGVSGTFWNDGGTVKIS